MDIQRRIDSLMEFSKEQLVNKIIELEEEARDMAIEASGEDR